jgi:hypothetical protein
MPKTAAQMTGMLVTSIIAFGTDMDALTAVPLGVFAGALSIFFVTLGEQRLDLQKN